MRCPRKWTGGSPKGTPVGKSLSLRTISGDDMEKYVVYVLKSIKDNFHYIGHSHDLEKRLKTHNKKKVRSTKGHAPFKIIYTETFSTRSEAFKREMYLKQIEGNIWLKQYLREKGLW